MFVLDTDHVTLYQHGNPDLQERLRDIPFSQISTTIVTYEEQVSGRLAVVRRAQEPQKRIQAFYWLQQTLVFFCHLPVLPLDPTASARFQQILDRKIRIGTQDKLIAAIVLANDATLLTRNRRDFEQIPDLKIEDWSTPV